MRRWHTLATVIVVLTVVCLWWWRASLENRHDVVILAAARRYGVDPALVKAVVWRESKFDQRARGSSGEIGLMQVNRLAAQEWAAAEGLRAFRHEELFDPGKNALAGSWYLGKLLKRYEKRDNPVPYALADYNAGRNNVLRWMHGAAVSNSVAFINQIEFPGTKRYVQSILARYEHYRPIFPPKHQRPAPAAGHNGIGPRLIARDPFEGHLQPDTQLLPLGIRGFAGDQDRFAELDLAAGEGQRHLELVPTARAHLPTEMVGDGHNGLPG